MFQSGDIFSKAVDIPNRRQPFYSWVEKRWVLLFRFFLNCDGYNISWPEIFSGGKLWSYFSHNSLFFLFCFSDVTDVTKRRSAVLMWWRYARLKLPENRIAYYNGTVQLLFTPKYHRSPHPHPFYFKHYKNTRTTLFSIS